MGDGREADGNIGGGDGLGAGSGSVTIGAVIAAGTAARRGEDVGVAEDAAGLEGSMDMGMGAGAGAVGGP